MRWADLDSLNHVNNVVYLDYACEAWPDLAAEGTLPEGRPTEVSVQFHRPILKTKEPVLLTAQREGNTLVQTIRATGDDGPAATVTSQFGTSPAPATWEPRASARALTLRYSDIDRTGEIGLPRVFELLQETRVPYLREILPEFIVGGFVIAHAEVTIHQPMMWHPEPLATQAWVTRVGGASFGVFAQVCRGEDVLATNRAVLVAFDVTTQRSANFNDGQREQLRAAMLS